MKWKREGEITEGGDVGGDWQVSDSWAVRYRSEEDPTRVVTAYFFGEVESDGDSEDQRGPFSICRYTEVTICEDPTLPPGDTEIWADGRYHEVETGIVIKDVPVRTLNEMARRWAGKHTAKDISWTGEPTWTGH